MKVFIRQRIKAAGSDLAIVDGSLNYYAVTVKYKYRQAIIRLRTDVVYIYVVQICSASSFV